MKIIYLLPFGSIEEEVMTVLEENLRQFFKWEIKKMAPQNIPVNAFNAVRNQYEALHLMRSVSEMIPNNATRLLAITEEDLSIPMLTFVYGQAQLNGQIAIMSLARLRQTFYGFPENKELFFNRTIKEAYHELGHTFGLVHCPLPECVMTLANDIFHVDAKNSGFCGGCSALLKDAIEKLN